MAMSWREAIERVLKEEARPLHYGEISQLVLSRGTARPKVLLPTPQ
jgi:hypothetical protein